MSKSIPLHPLDQELRAKTMPAADALVEPLDNDALRCVACGHRCKILPGRSGVCRIRVNEGGVLRVPQGYVAGLAVDPIEKKPLFHVTPGAGTLSFGMLGCNFHCSFCQNWITSQTLRDDDAISTTHTVSAERVAMIAAQRGCKILTSTYNEPLITAEWAVRVFEEGRKLGLSGAFVSNGNGTPEVYEYLAPYLKMCNVDLKAFRPQTYRKLGAQLQNTLDSIKEIHRRGIWLEVTTLIIPEMNDSDEELRGIAEFLAGVSPDIPWHVSAFRPQYKLTEPPPTPPETLLRACEIGEQAGLRYIYTGNLPGRTGNYESTRCPNCATTVVERVGYRVKSNRLEDGACPACQARIPGLWTL